MMQYKSNYVNYLSTLIEEYHKKEEELRLDDRKDESILYKVRANICDIFLKMVNASDKKIAGMKLTSEEAQTKAFLEDYLTWFEKIPANWKSNLELAKKHDDILVVETEEVKLETANLLRSKLLELSGSIIPINMQEERNAFVAEDKSSCKSEEQSYVEMEE